MTPISVSEAKDWFVKGLKNAHAMERQCQAMVATQLERLENYPMVEARLRQHHDENERQVERLERILGELKEKPSSMKDTVMGMAGNMAATGNAAAEDEVLKNGMASFAFAHFEIAAYESLITMGEAAGQIEAIRDLQSSLSEERDFAAWLAENMRGVTKTFLQLRSDGATAKH